MYVSKMEVVSQLYKFWSEVLQSYESLPFAVITLAFMGASFGMVIYYNPGSHRHNACVFVAYMTLLVANFLAAADLKAPYEQQIWMATSVHMVTVLTFTVHLVYGVLYRVNECCRGESYNSMA